MEDTPSNVELPVPYDPGLVCCTNMGTNEALKPKNNKIKSSRQIPFESNFIFPLSAYFEPFKLNPWIHVKPETHNHQQREMTVYVGRYEMLLSAHCEINLNKKHRWRASTVST